MSDSAFNFNEFIKESKDSLVNPKAYFASMKTEGGLGEPIIKALIYGTVAGIIGLIWSLLHVSPAVGGIFGSAVGITVLLFAIIGSLIGVFIGAVIVLVISAIAGGKTDFEPCMRVSAALMVLMPVSAFLGFTGSIHYFLGAIVSLAINLYGLWMLYQALVQPLQAKEGTTRIIMYVLAGLLVLFMLLGLGARRAVRHYDPYGKEFRKKMEQTSKEWEKALNEMEKASKDEGTKGDEEGESSEEDTLGEQE
ncbi:MAG TPA: Yip1 family protein [Bacteroidales bacterium]|nr:Yip1 family protein [Bacteroidales bacterium]